MGGRINVMSKDWMMWLNSSFITPEPLSPPSRVQKSQAWWWKRPSITSSVEITIVFMYIILLMVQNSCEKTTWDVSHLVNNGINNLPINWWLAQDFWTINSTIRYLFSSPEIFHALLFLGLGIMSSPAASNRGGGVIFHPVSLRQISGDSSETTVLWTELPPQKN